ncbi:MAG: hypothetical protein ACK47R_23255, partial [Planctomycetia bacterium]
YIDLVVYSPATSTLNVAQNATITGDRVLFSAQSSSNTINLASGANVTAVAKVEDNGAGVLNLASNITVTNSINGIILDNLSINLTGASSLKSASTTAANGKINLGSVNGAQNLTVEATGAITMGYVGQSTSLGTVTVTKSASVLFNDAFTAANVVLSDTAGTIDFDCPTVITTSLTTAAKAYSVIFGDTTVLAGAPVFLNTGDVVFAGAITSLTSGATIAGGSLADVSLAGTIISDGAFNIGPGLNSITVANGIQLILNSTSVESTFASPISLNGLNVGSLNLLGVGTLTLSANSTAGVTTGDSINVTNGTLNVTGTLGSASTIALTNATLSGAGGTTGAVTTTVGNVAPGGT